MRRLGADGACRWDVEPPAEEGGEWHMKVSATRDIESGEELLLSYGTLALGIGGADNERGK